MNDLRFALRQLIRRPGFTATAAGTLALGIGTTLAVFTVVHGVLLRDLPYPEPDRLALVWRGDTEDPDQRGALSPPDVLDLQEQATAFRDLAAVNSFSTNFIGDDGGPEQIALGVVAGDFFSVLGVRAALGRSLEPADDRPLDTRDSTATGVLVLAHDFWMRRFAGDSTVVGRTVRIGAGRMRVVGVLPATFHLLMPAGAGMSTDLAGWTPLGIDYATAPRDGAYLKVLGRLREGVTVGQAQAELENIAARVRTEHPVHEDAGFRFRVASLEREVVAHIRPVLLLLAATGVVVLLVACGNVAVLLLVRFLGRRHEIAIRTAIGADRPRVVRQLLLEAGLLAGLGSALGLLVAAPAVAALLRLEPGIVPRTSDLGVDASVGALALLLATCAALICGLAPAVVATRGTWGGLMRVRSDAGAGGSRLRRGLVVAQVAAAFALLYGGASLLATLVRLERADLGFRAEAVQTFRVTLPFTQYRGPNAWVAFFDELTGRIAAEPAITGAAFTSELPMTRDLAPEPYASTERAGDGPWGSRTALHRIVSPRYFSTLGIRLLLGREFVPADREGSSPVAVIDEPLARRLEREEPGPVLGRRLDVTRHEFRAGYRVTRATVEVVGVVAVVPHEHPDADPPGTVYLPHAQYPLWSMAIAVAGPAGVPALDAARRVLDRMNPELPMIESRPLAAVVGAVLAPTRFVLALIGVFGLIAIGLTAVGLYGLVAETVRQRRRELGIRLAVGAEPRSLGRRVLAGGLALPALGMVPGLLLAPLTGRMIARAVIVPAGLHLPTLTAAAAAVLAVAAAAAWVPARRATRIDPMEALRHE